MPTGDERKPRDAADVRSLLSGTSLTLLFGSISVIGTLAAIGFAVASSYNDYLGITTLQPADANAAVVLGGTFLLGALREVFACLTEMPFLSVGFFLGIVAIVVGLNLVLQRKWASPRLAALVTFTVRIGIISVGLAALYAVDLPYLEIRDVLTRSPTTRVDVPGSDSYNARAVAAYDLAMCSRLRWSTLPSTPLRDQVTCWQKQHSVAVKHDGGDAARGAAALAPNDFDQLAIASRRIRLDFVISLVIAASLVALALLPAASTAGAETRMSYLNNVSGVLVVVVAMLCAGATPLLYARTTHPTRVPRGTIVHLHEKKFDTLDVFVLTSSAELTTVLTASSTGRILILPTKDVVSTMIDSLSDPVAELFAQAIKKAAPPPSPSQ
jgi:hypothetical protein